MGCLCVALFASVWSICINMQFICNNMSDGSEVRKSIRITDLSEFKLIAIEKQVWNLKQQQLKNVWTLQAPTDKT